MATPLYNSLKRNGTTTYTFPSSAEDIHDNYEFDFMNSKVMLLNIPRKVDGKIFEFLNVDPSLSAFYSDPAYLNNFPNGDSSFGAQMVNSIRNYVANQEVMIRQSRTGESSYFYNVDELTTNTEKIFWKWLRKTNALKLQKANDQTYAIVNKREYNKTDDETIVNPLRWVERTPEAINVVVSGFNIVGDFIEITLNGQSELIVGDSVIIGGTYSGLLTAELEFLGYTDTDPLTVTEVSHIITNVTTDLSNNTVITISILDFGGGFNTSNLNYINNSGILTCTVILDYERVVQYMGEVSSINKVKQQNESYTEVYAHISASCGKTPTILFKTDFNNNYEPNLTFPILPEDDLPDGVISGAEFATNKLNTNPLDYVGNKYGQFDNDDYKYTTSAGNPISGRGEYFGITEIDGTVITIPTQLDGLTIDWDKTSYYKITPEINTFEQFSTLVENGIAPQAFEFNCVLWYYDLVDKKTGDVKATNLYAIQFMDNPNNDVEKPLEKSKINTLRKFVANGIEDGNSYTLKLNRKYDITADNIIPTFNPEMANRPVEFSMFADAMTKLNSLLYTFIDIVERNESISAEVEELRQLFLNQDSIDKILIRIDALDSLLRKLQTLQIKSSEDIQADLDTTSNPPMLSMTNLSPYYKAIQTVNSSELYSDVYSTITPKNIPVVTGRNQLVRVVNNDVNNLTIEGDFNLKITLDKELAYKQKIEFDLFASNGYENKKLDITVPLFNSTTNTTTETNLISNVDLPIDIRDLGADETDFDEYFSNVKRWNGINVNKVESVMMNDVDYSPIKTLKLTFTENTYLKSGDIIYVDNLILYSDSGLNPINFSGQYRILDVIDNGQSVYIDLESQKSGYYTYLTDNTKLNDDAFTSDNIKNPITIKTVKGLKIEIVRILNDTTSSVSERYSVTKKYIYE